MKLYYRIPPRHPELVKLSIFDLLASYKQTDIHVTRDVGVRGGVQESG